MNHHLSRLHQLPKWLSFKRSLEKPVVCYAYIMTDDVDGPRIEEFSAKSDGKKSHAEPVLCDKLRAALKPSKKDHKLEKETALGDVREIVIVQSESPCNDDKDGARCRDNFRALSKDLPVSLIVYSDRNYTPGWGEPPSPVYRFEKGECTVLGSWVEGVETRVGLQNHLSLKASDLTGVQLAKTKGHILYWSHEARKAKFGTDYYPDKAGKKTVFFEAKPVGSKEVEKYRSDVLGSLAKGNITEKEADVFFGC